MKNVPLFGKLFLQAARGKQPKSAKLSVSPPAPNVLRDEPTVRHGSSRMSITLSQVEETKTVSPADVQSGAILAMALGLCVTALLLVLVGCKLRLVKRSAVLIGCRQKTGA